MQSESNDGKYYCTKIDTKDDYDFILKCIIVGDGNVGKTSILNRLTDQEFVLNEKSTIGIDFGTIYSEISPQHRTVHLPTQKSIELKNPASDNEISEIKVDGKDGKGGKHGKNGISVRGAKNVNMEDRDEKYVKVQLWDCAGQVRFRSIVQSYFRQAQIVLFVYDTNNHASFESLSEWILTVDKHIGRGNYVGCIVANKSDLAAVIELPLIQRFCEVNKDFTYYSLSAKDDASENILKPLLECILSAYTKYEKGEITISKPYWRDSTVDLNDDGFSNSADCISRCVIL